MNDKRRINRVFPFAVSAARLSAHARPASFAVGAAGLCVVRGPGRVVRMPREVACPVCGKAPKCSPPGKKGWNLYRCGNHFSCFVKWDAAAKAQGEPDELDELIERTNRLIKKGR